MKLYAWYSEGQRKIAGLVEYENENKERVLCTLVTDTPEHSTKFNDIESRGKVTKFIARREEGNLF